MAATPGGLVKGSVQLFPHHWQWLKARAKARGHASVAAVMREVLDAAMAAEYRERGTDADVAEGGG